MSFSDEKLMKLAHNVKRTKAKKPTHFAPPSNQIVDSSRTSSLVINLDHDTPGSELVPRKRNHRGEVVSDTSMDVGHDPVFLMPQCFTEDGYFERFPLIVSLVDAHKIEDLDLVARTKQLYED